MYTRYIISRIKPLSDPRLIKSASRLSLGATRELRRAERPLSGSLLATSRALLSNSRPPRRACSQAKADPIIFPVSNLAVKIGGKASDLDRWLRGARALERDLGFPFLSFDLYKMTPFSLFRVDFKLCGMCKEFQRSRATAGSIEQGKGDEEDLCPRCRN